MTIEAEKYVIEEIAVLLKPALPGPAWGAYSASPNSLAGLKGGGNRGTIGEKKKGEREKGRRERLGGNLLHYFYGGQTPLFHSILKNEQEGLQFKQLISNSHKMNLYGKEIRGQRDLAEAPSNNPAQ